VFKLFKNIRSSQHPVRTPEIPPKKISNLDECASHRHEELKQMMNKMRKESKK